MSFFLSFIVGIGYIWKVNIRNTTIDHLHIFLSLKITNVAREIVQQIEHYTLNHPSSIFSILYDPWATPEVIPECRFRKNPWALPYVAQGGRKKKKKKTRRIKQSHKSLFLFIFVLFIFRIKPQGFLIEVWGKTF